MARTPKPTKPSLMEFAAGRRKAVPWHEQITPELRAELHAGIEADLPTRAILDWLREIHGVRVGKDSLSIYIRSHRRDG